MEQIYNCEKLEIEKTCARTPFEERFEEIFEEIFEIDVKKQLEISKQFFKKLEKREKIEK